MTVSIHIGDCRDVLATLPEASFDSCVTDPPYGLNFMGKDWDRGVPGVPFWTEVYRVLKPGAHLLAFSGTRTYHRMVCAIEDAGFEIRDQIGWAYGSGFPKSLDVSKAIDKAAGVEFEAKPAAGVGFMGPDRPGGYNRTINQLTRIGTTTPEAAAWQGWGTALKPAWEPICVARKPLVGTVAANVQQFGTGAINIDGCRIEANEGDIAAAAVPNRANLKMFVGDGRGRTDTTFDMSKGRWPANLVHDGSDEVLAAFPEGRSAGNYPSDSEGTGRGVTYLPTKPQGPLYDDKGSAARFFKTCEFTDDERRLFYCPKASTAERNKGVPPKPDGKPGNDHATVKPVALMRWLVRLVTPPGGRVLDPFAGSGTTGVACSIEQFDATLIEMDPKFAGIARSRIEEEGGLFGRVAAE